jgi:hypothetical protein
VNVLAKAAGANRSSTGERLRGLAQRGVVTKDANGRWRLVGDLAGEAARRRRRRRADAGGAGSRTHRAYASGRASAMAQAALELQQARGPRVLLRALRLTSSASKVFCRHEPASRPTAWDRLDRVYKP